jgi:hypothetical protein
LRITFGCTPRLKEVPVIGLEGYPFEVDNDWQLYEMMLGDEDRAGDHVLSRRLELEAGPKVLLQFNRIIQRLARLGSDSD